MAEHLLIGALFLIAAGMTVAAVWAYFGHYWYRWRHLQRGHDYHHIGRWAEAEHWRCWCGQWFSTRSDRSDVT
jgi:hypothetical protein